MENKPYFRPGAGSVIFNTNGEILVFERANLPGVWQLQQGGMNADETIEQTLWREVAEETGLLKDCFSTITEYPHWTIYAYPPEFPINLKYQNTLGQAHRWFFLSLNGNSTVDLNKATDKEFINWRWTTFSNLLQQTNNMKLRVYQELADFFQGVVLPQQTNLPR